MSIDVAGRLPDEAAGFRIPLSDVCGRAIPRPAGRAAGPTVAEYGAFEFVREDVDVFRGAEEAMEVDRV